MLCFASSPVSAPGGVFVLAALSSLATPARPTRLMVRTRGFHDTMVRRLRVRKLRKQKRWLNCQSGLVILAPTSQGRVQLLNQRRGLSLGTASRQHPRPIPEASN